MSEKQNRLLYLAYNSIINFILSVAQNYWPIATKKINILIPINIYQSRTFPYSRKIGYSPIIKSPGFLAPALHLVLMFLPLPGCKAFSLSSILCFLHSTPPIGFFLQLYSEHRFYCFCLVNPGTSLSSSDKICLLMQPSGATTPFSETSPAFIISAAIDAGSPVQAPSFQRCLLYMLPGFTSYTVTFKPDADHYPALWV